MLILLVAVKFGILPTGGGKPLPQALILPVLVLGLRPFANAFQLTRTTMLGEYNKQYVMALRARFAAGDDTLTFKVWTLVVFQLWYEEQGLGRLAA